jgi:hypothetical protein
MFIFLMWGAIYMVGCTDTPSDPGFDAMPPVEDVEIELATDPDLTASLIEDVSSSMTANMTAAASLEISTAQTLFNQARVELTRSNYAQVRTLGDQARDALGRALSRGRDGSSLNDYIDRARDVQRRLAGGDNADFDRPDELRRHLDRLLDETDVALSRGDHATAGRRAVDAHERTDRSRARRHDVDPEKGARLVAAMAAQAVELANRLLNRTEIDERTQHLLDTAARLAAASAEAFQNHQFRRAIMLGHKAVNVSLMAVIRPDKVTDKGFGALIDAARAELAAAEAKLTLEPNEELQKLFDRAVEAFESGLELIENGNNRGVQLVWRAAVVGAVIAN